MKLNTKILDAKGEAVRYEVKTTRYNPEKPADPVDVSIFAPGIGALGWMRYSVYRDDGFLEIRRMYNESTFKHVGTALFEYAFRKSIEVGMDGKVQLRAIESSPGAYFNMGFRAKSRAADYLNRAIQEYRSTPTWGNKNKIQTHDRYPALVQEAAISLKKSATNITFEEAIQHGHVGQQNSDFKKILDARKEFRELLNEYSSSPSSKLKEAITSHALYSALISKAKDAKKEKLPTAPEEISFEDAILYGSADIERVNWLDCYKCYMHGTMFLPDDIIAQKKIEFGITPALSSQAAVGEVKDHIAAKPSPLEKAPRASSPLLRWSILVAAEPRSVQLTSEECAAITHAAISGKRPGYSM